MEFTSLWEQAGDDAEAARHEAALTQAQAAASGVWPFVSLAKTATEFEHRLALAEDRIEAVASQYGVSPEEITGAYRTAFTALAEQRQEHTAVRDDEGTDRPEPRQASMQHEATEGPACRNCGHANPPHRKGGQCSSCGCDSYQPHTRGAGPRRAERHSSFDAHIAMLRQALMEGEDPLAWVEQVAPQGANPEKPSEHDTQPEPYTYAEVPPGPQGGPGEVTQRAQGSRRHPF